MSKAPSPGGGGGEALIYTGWGVHKNMKKGDLKHRHNPKKGSLSHGHTPNKGGGGS